MRYSWPSSLTSLPEYLPKRIRSPSFTARGSFLPSSVTLPVPTAITLPSCGFSLAVSGIDRKSTRLNSSHQIISYAVFCLNKKNDVEPPNVSQLHGLVDAQSRPPGHELVDQGQRGRFTDDVLARHERQATDHQRLVNARVT